MVNSDALVRPQSSSSSSTTTATAPVVVRPTSASNLSASIANARFKTFAVQYELLHRNPLLCAIATEIPWTNLLELCTLKFIAASDALARQNEPTHELAFVLCGGFAARYVDSNNNANSKSVTERLVKPGSSLAAYAVHTNTPLPYSIVAVKFKSIVLTLPSGKYKSMLRQLSPSLVARIEQLVGETENALRLALALPRLAIPKPTVRTSSSSSSCIHPTRATMRHSASTPALSGSSKQAPLLDTTASWASLLTITKPVEYAVDSSLLLLHDTRPFSAPTAAGPTTLTSAAASHKQSKRAPPPPTMLQASAAARTTAKQHTQRRMQRIKLPRAVDAFVPALPHSAAATATSTSASDRQRAVQQLRTEIAARDRVGRLLQPLRVPVTVSHSDNSNDRRQSRAVSLERQMHMQRVLVADRTEPFRAEW